MNGWVDWKTTSTDLQWFWNLLNKHIAQNVPNIDYFKIFKCEKCLPTRKFIKKEQTALSSLGSAYATSGMNTIKSFIYDA